MHADASKREIIRAGRKVEDLLRLLDDDGTLVPSAQGFRLINHKRCFCSTTTGNTIDVVDPVSSFIKQGNNLKNHRYAVRIKAAPDLKGDAVITDAIVINTHDGTDIRQSYKITSVGALDLDSGTWRTGEVWIFLQDTDTKIQMDFNSWGAAETHRCVLDVEAYKLADAVSEGQELLTS